MSSKPYRDMTDTEQQRHRENVQHYRENNPDQVTRYNKAYRESHKGQHKNWDATEKKRYVRIKHQAITLLGGQCVRCHCDDMRCLEIDHIIPVRGDRSTYGAKLYLSIVKGNRENVQVLCACCHAIKTYEDGNGAA